VEKPANAAAGRAPRLSNPVAITVTRTESPIASSITAPKMMFGILVAGRADDLGGLVHLEQARGRGRR
jgi:hypothetical protein